MISEIEFRLRNFKEPQLFGYSYQYEIKELLLPNIPGQETFLSRLYGKTK